ncbi:MAG: hypothetical protein ACTS27_03970 [Phycisphaerales bacterium]
MGKGLSKLGIDWSNSATFVMLWLVFSFITVGFIEPRHGGWKNRVRWGFNPTSSSNEPPPEWFPIPLVAADPKQRVVEGRESSLRDDVQILRGVTTYEEWTKAGDTLRVREATGVIVTMRREDVVVMPLQPDKNSAEWFKMPSSKSTQSEPPARFPKHVNSGIQRGSAGSNFPSHDVISMHAEFPKDEWASATLLRFDDGSFLPVDATLHLPGFSPAAKRGMTFAAVIAAAIAFLGTWALQALSRRIERRNA